MKQYPIWMTFTALIISACGTSVSTGRNKHPRSKGSDKGGTTNAGEKLERLSHDSCFGDSSPKAKIVVSFCDSLDDHNHSHFGRLTKLLCDDNQLSNLFLSECGWDGTGRPESFILPIEHTPINDQKSDNFYYMSAFGVTMKGSNRSLKDMLLYAYTNLTKFRDRFVFPANTNVTPRGPVKKKDGEQVLVYDMEINGSVAKTKFSAELRAYEVMPNHEVVTERLVPEISRPEGIKTQRSLQFSFPTDDGFQKIVVIEEYEVPDRGLHDIALTVLKDLDKNRMRLFYDNFQIKE